MSQPLSSLNQLETASEQPDPTSWQPEPVPVAGCMDLWSDVQSEFRVLQDIIPYQVNCPKSEHTHTHTNTPLKLLSFWAAALKGDEVL